jgi:hypothetical protein
VNPSKLFKYNGSIRVQDESTTNTKVIYTWGSSAVFFKNYNQYKCIVWNCLSILVDMNLLVTIYPSLTPYLLEGKSSLIFRVDETTFRNAESYNNIKWPDFSLLNVQIGKIDGVVRSMDRTRASYPYVFTSVISLSGDGGIVLHINTLMETFGFYFASYSKKASIPVKHSNADDYNISYYPFSEEQISACLNVEALVRTTFPSYQKFDSSHSTIQIQQLYISEDSASNIDAFQAIFSNNMHGLI